MISMALAVATVKDGAKDCYVGSEYVWQRRVLIKKSFA